MGALSWFLDLIYPPKCVFCGKLLPRGSSGWCTPCERALPYSDSLRTGQFFTVCAAPLEYRDAVRSAVLRYKFQGCDCYAPAFSAFLADAVRFHKIAADCITWVPVSRARRRRRGYDPAQLLARELGRQLGLPVEGLLEKIVENRTQSELRAEERRANVLGVYQPTRPERIAGKRILLVDDVVTTGSTLEECSRVLCTAGAAEVNCAAFACAVPKTEEEEYVSTDR